MKPYKNLRYVEIGEVAVDSGMLRITDPCYEKDFDGDYSDRKISAGDSVTCTFSTKQGDGWFKVYEVWSDDIFVGVMVGF